ncbi:hypothetical protein B7L68_05875 [Thermoproteus sp. CP80]|uniref:hypothetical protein n=1 Tax=Thermoproteus sp. CP80 TaxID=1650659 RepID=UPI0009C0DE8F|nr:hypothetical protein [Thermoproteus sp. CP80]PLC63987.1 hypothetical protein B7L68_05875 [Thermoproteus sp. CP80]
MRVGMLICLLAALAALAAAQFEYYMPIDSHTVYIGQAQFGEFVYSYGDVAKIVNGQRVLITFHGLNPGMEASPWLPNGTGIEYSYTRATALFNITNVNPRTDVEWYIFGLSSPDIWVSIPVAIVYGLSVAVKSGGPVLNVSCLKALGNGFYNYTCPSSPRARLDYVMAYYAAAYSNAYLYKFVLVRTNLPEYYNMIMGEKFEIYNVTVRDLGTRFFCVGFNSLLPIATPVKCVPMADPPRNVTVDVRPYNATASAVDVYVDGQLFHTFYVNGSDAVLYTGPYADPLMATAAAFIELNYPGRPLKPLGSVLLLIGNDTVMAPPRYVLKALEPGPVFVKLPGKTYPDLFFVNPGRDETWADADLTWSGVYVLPGDTGSNATVYQWLTVPARVSGRAVELPYLAMINLNASCRYGVAEASGEYSPLGGGWIRVLGPVSVYCTEYPVEFLLPNGTSAAVVAPYNGTLVWTPPPIAYANGTMLEADAVAVFVDGPKSVRVNYTRVYYLVRVETPLGVNETWMPRGAALSVPAVIYLGNGTRLVARAVDVNGNYVEAKTPVNGTAVALSVEGPMDVSVAYSRQYLVRLEAPANSTEVWADAGSTFTVDLPDPWEPGNGTLFKALLINGTSAREWRVEGPMTLVARYAETYYWVTVKTPLGVNETWMPRGAVLRFPSVVYLGNGTRLVGPNASAVEVEGPMRVEVSYSKRQYYVEVEGVERWEGWADAYSLIRLNSTAVDGVEYTPTVAALRVSAPGVYRPFFEAVYRAVVRDALGMPNPLATARLCNATSKAGLDGSVYIAIETRELCRPEVEAAPVSPYTAALIALAAAAAAAVALRRRK